MAISDFISFRTFQVLTSTIPVPEFVPAVRHTFNDYFVFDLNVPAIHAALYLVYYLLLEPFAAVRNLPHLSYR